MTAKAVKTKSRQGFGLYKNTVREKYWDITKRVTVNLVQSSTLTVAYLDFMSYTSMPIQNLSPDIFSGSDWSTDGNGLRHNDIVNIVKATIYEHTSIVWDVVILQTPASQLLAQIHGLCASWLKAQTITSRLYNACFNVWSWESRWCCEFKPCAVKALPQLELINSQPMLAEEKKLKHKKAIT